MTLLTGEPWWMVAPSDEGFMGLITVGDFSGILKTYNDTRYVTDAGYGIHGSLTGPATVPFPLLFELTWIVSSTGVVQTLSTPLKGGDLVIDGVRVDIGAIPFQNTLGFRSDTISADHSTWDGKANLPYAISDPVFYTMTAGDVSGTTFGYNQGLAVGATDYPLLRSLLWQSVSGTNRIQSGNLGLTRSSPTTIWVGQQKIDLTSVGWSLSGGIYYNNAPINVPLLPLSAGGVYDICISYAGSGA